MNWIPLDLTLNQQLSLRTGYDSIDKMPANELRTTAKELYSIYIRTDGFMKAAVKRIAELEAGNIGSQYTPEALDKLTEDLNNGQVV